MNTFENATTAAQEDRFEEVEQYREGPVARTIERQTAKLPSDIFLWAAGASIVGALAAQVFGMRRQTGMLGGLFSPVRAQTREPLAGFIGMWAPTFLLLGLYNKLVKVAGSDRVEH